MPCCVPSHMYNHCIRRTKCCTKGDVPNSVLLRSGGKKCGGTVPPTLACSQYFDLRACYVIKPRLYQLVVTALPR